MYVTSKKLAAVCLYLVVFFAPFHAFAMSYTSTESEVVPLLVSSAEYTSTSHAASGDCDGKNQQSYNYGCLCDHCVSYLSLCSLATIPGFGPSFMERTLFGGPLTIKPYIYKPPIIA